MKKKLNLTKLTEKELKSTTGGAATCFCICKIHPEQGSDFDFSNFVITTS